MRKIFLMAASIIPLSLGLFAGAKYKPYNLSTSISSLAKLGLLKCKTRDYTKFYRQTPLFQFRYMALES
jgi:hypothetical protein